MHPHIVGISFLEECIMKTTSIKFRLVSGGIILVLLPLLAIGYISITKSTLALSDLAKNQAQNIAADLAGTADKILKEQVKIAEVLAADELVVDTASSVKEAGVAGAGDKIAALYKSLGIRFAKLGSMYQGVFISDVEGNLFTGVLEGGKEYKGSNVADRDYFQAAKSSGKTTIGSVVRSKTTEKLISVICVPISTDRGFVGALGLVLKVEFITEMISGKKLGVTGYGYMTDKKE